MEDRIEKVVELVAPVARVWRALTDHEEFGRWFRVALDGPFEVGKVSSGRIDYPGYEHLRWQAIVECMDRESRFSFRWPVDFVEGEADLTAAPTTLVDFRLEPTAAGTRLTIVESGFESLPDPRRLEALRENTDGWNEQARNIAAHVAN